MRHSIFLPLLLAISVPPVLSADLGIDIDSIVAGPVKPLHPERYTKALARKLGLDEGQQAQIRKLLKEEKTEMGLLEDQKKQHFQAIKATKLKIYDVHYEMQRRVDASEERVRGVLTPKQKIKFDRLRAKSKKGRRRAVRDDAPPARKAPRSRRKPSKSIPQIPGGTGGKPVDSETMPPPGVYR